MVERVVVGPWKTNCYIYSSSKKECIIIDPGGDEEEIASRVDVLNMVPIGIAITHGHIDHVVALGKLRAGYASRGYSLPIAIHPADRRFLGSGGRETHRESLEFLGMDEFVFFGGESPVFPRADVRLEAGDRVFGMDLVVIETPGHTPGGVCFYGEKEGVLFSGDTLFFDGVGRTDLPGGSEKKLRESIQRKIAVLPPETRVFPGHGPFTTIEREKRGNPLLREAPAEAVQTANPKPSAQQKRARPKKPARKARIAPKKAALKKAARKARVTVRRPARKGGPVKAAGKRKAVRPGTRKPAKTARARLRKPVRAKTGTLRAAVKSAKAAGKKGGQARRSTTAPRRGRKPAR